MSASNLRFGIIGCGSIAPTHVAALQRIAGVEVVAVADVVAERAAKLADKFGVSKVYASHTELIADGAVDVVVGCTPSGMHVDHAIEAMQAGKHAIVEKPMDVSLQKCDQMIELASKSKLKFSVISQHRWDRASRFVRSAIDEGKLGDIVLATASIKWWRTQNYYDSGDWRGTFEMDGGGCLMNQGVHTIDLLQWLAGEVTHIFAHTRTSAHDRIEVEDIAAATLRFKSGAVGTIVASTAAYPGFPARIDLYGTEGSAIIEGDKLHTLALKSGESFDHQRASAHALSVARGGTASVKDEAAAREENEEEGEVWGDAHRAQLEDFVSAIRDDRDPLITAEGGKAPLKIVLGVYESARQGKEIAV